MKSGNKLNKSIRVKRASKSRKNTHTLKHNKASHSDTSILSTKHKAHNIIQLLLQLQTQVKFIHWNSKQYSLHMITDKFHEKLSGHIDELVEVCIGKNIKLMPLSHYYSNITEPSHNAHSLADSTKKVIENTVHGLNTHSSHLNHRDIQAILDVILIDINRFKYLLQMV